MVDGLCPIEMEGAVGEAFVVCGGGLSGLFLTCSFDSTILSIDEAARVAEDFLGPYTVYEHGKLGNVVRSPRVNKECSGLRVRLPEREEPDDERRRKRSCPADDESSEAIPTFPLRGMALDASVEDRNPPAKRGAHLMALPSPGDASAQNMTSLSGDPLDVGNFEIIDICPEEESGESTPSATYALDDTVDPSDSRQVPMTPGRDAAGELFWRGSANPFSVCCVLLDLTYFAGSIWQGG